MSRSWASRIRIVAILALLACQSLPAALTAASSQELPDQAKAQLKERNRLWKESHTLHGQGKLAQAITAAQTVLAIERKVLAADDPDLAVSLDWLAQLSFQRKDFTAALAARQEALQIVQKRFGEAHWKATDARLAVHDVKLQASLTGEQREGLAQASRFDQNIVALVKQRKYAEAAEAYRPVLAIRKEVRGERHPSYATSLNTLASVLQLQGDYAAATSLYERAPAIHKAGTRRAPSRLRHEPEHPGRVAPSAGRLRRRATSVRAGAGDPQGGAGRAPPTEHFATTLDNLAALLYSQGDYAGARPLFERALAIRKDVLGERHPEYATSLDNLAALLYSQGDYPAARALYERVLAIYKEAFGERHPDCALSLNNLAFLLQSQGDYAAARPLYERALAIRKEVLGERHPDYAASLNNLAESLQSQGDYAAARPLFERALAILKEVLGERHAAGAHSVIASLWKVGDEPTRALMAAFYENLWRKYQSAAQALREAQLAMLRGDLDDGGLKREDETKSDRLPPYYWAAFVLSTDSP